MPELDQCFEGNCQGGDQESGSGSEVIIGDDGVSVPQGTASSDYDYDVVSDGTVVGMSYCAVNTSAMTCNQSVAVMSKVYAFAATDNSSAVLNSCVSYAGNLGFSSVSGSSCRLAYCIAAKHKFSYYATAASSISTHYCCGIFPLDYNVYCNGTSTFSSVEFETMTKINALSSAVTQADFQYNQPVHFGAFGNCIVQNSSEAFASRSTLGGFSGGIIGTNNIRFFWSELSHAISNLSTNVASGIGSSTVASYRYVPLQHSVDYNVNTNSTDAQINPSSDAFQNIPALMAVIAYRTNYVSVKPPRGIFLPEDNSGNRATVFQLNNSYSISELSRQGFNI